MRTPLFLRISSCIMMLILPTSLVAAELGAAMLHTNGTTWLNGSSIPNSSAIFPDDLVQTKADSIGNISAAGLLVTVSPDSLLQFGNNALKLERGAVRVATSRAMSIRAGEVTVTPASKVWTDFEVSDSNGKVQIAARKGDVMISDDTGTTTLPQGQEGTRENPETRKEKKKSTGAAPAAQGGILDSRAAILVETGVLGGLAIWVLTRRTSASPDTP
jgi:hypothetical protein